MDRPDEHAPPAAPSPLGGGALGLVLGLLARRNGQQARGGPWYVLGPRPVDQAERALARFEDHGDARTFELVLDRVLEPAWCVALPAWVGALLEDEPRLQALVDTVGAWPPTLAELEPAGPRARGLAHLALAYGHHPETLGAIARRLPAAEAEVFTRIGEAAGLFVPAADCRELRHALRVGCAAPSSEEPDGPHR